MKLFSTERFGQLCQNVWQLSCGLDWSNGWNFPILSKYRGHYELFELWKPCAAKNENESKTNLKYFGFYNFAISLTFKKFKWLLLETWIFCVIVKTFWIGGKWNTTTGFCIIWKVKVILFIINFSFDDIMTKTKKGGHNSMLTLIALPII